MTSDVTTDPMNGTASAFQSVSESSIDTVTGEQRVELKGARAAAAAWAALTPEQQEAKRKALRKRVEAEAAEISARFSVLPAVEDMKRLYDVAAQIAVMEQWWVATDRRRDSHMLIIGDARRWKTWMRRRSLMSGPAYKTKLFAG